MTGNAVNVFKPIRDAVSSLGWLVFLFGIVFVAYQDTWLSMLDIWLRMDTFSHCLLVMPISAYLSWRKRDELKRVRSCPSGLGTIILFVLAIAWWLSLALGLQVGMHAAVVAMLPTLVLALYGTSVTRILWFPLAFLVFAIPFGEFVIPTLVDITASLTVNNLRAFGIPVIREGQYFYVSSGSYSIAKACAGLKYTIAALAFASLAAKVYFNSWVRGVLFIGVAVILSIVANGVRATAIVLIMHYSDFDISAPKDHQFVGWIAYTLLVVLLLGIAAWLGNSREKRDGSDTKKDEYERTGSDVSFCWPTWAVTLGCAVAIGSGAILSTISASASHRTQSYLDMPRVAGWDYSSGVRQDVVPSYDGFAEALTATYSRDTATVYASLFIYQDTNQDSEMVNAASFVLPEHEWKIDFPSTVGLGEDALPTVLETVGRSQLGEGHMLVWYWYEVNGRHTISTFEVKLMEAKSFLRFQPVESKMIVLTMPIRDSREEARRQLREFASGFYPELRERDLEGSKTDSNTARNRRDRYLCVG